MKEQPNYPDLATVDWKPLESSQVAKQLGIAEDTLYRKRKKFFDTGVLECPKFFRIPPKKIIWPDVWVNAYREFHELQRQGGAE